MISLKCPFTRVTLFTAPLLRCTFDFLYSVWPGCESRDRAASRGGTDAPREKHRHLRGASSQIPCTGTAVKPTLISSFYEITNSTYQVFVHPAPNSICIRIFIEMVNSSQAFCVTSNSSLGVVKSYTSAGILS